jgi:hypothetical protein
VKGTSAIRGENGLLARRTGPGCEAEFKRALYIQSEARQGMPGIEEAPVDSPVIDLARRLSPI